MQLLVCTWNSVDSLCQVLLI